MPNESPIEKAREAWQITRIRSVLEADDIASNRAEGLARAIVFSEAWRRVENNPAGWEARTEELAVAEGQVEGMAARLRELEGRREARTPEAREIAKRAWTASSEACIGQILAGGTTRSFEEWWATVDHALARTPDLPDCVSQPHRKCRTAEGLPGVCRRCPRALARTPEGDPLGRIGVDGPLRTLAGGECQVCGGETEHHPDCEIGYLRAELDRALARTRDLEAREPTDDAATQALRDIEREATRPLDSMLSEAHQLRERGQSMLNIAQAALANRDPSPPTPNSSKSIQALGDSEG